MQRGVTKPSVGAMAQVILATAVLGVGVALLLDARLGADGFAMLIDGLSIRLGWEFVVVNTAVSAVLVIVAWIRGITPGFGTFALPVLVGGVVSLLDGRLPAPESMSGRLLEFALALALVCVGVAGYLAAECGIAATEAIAMAFDPPVPFRWSYSIVQVVGGVIGYWCGADLGVGTVVVMLTIGPVVDRLLPYFKRADFKR